MSILTLSIAPRTFSLVGPVRIKFDPRSDIRSGSRRLSKTQTLDGGVAIRDSGYVEGDRTMTVYPIDLSSSDADAIEAMALTQSAVTVCTADGAYEASIQSYVLDNASPRVVLSIYRRLSA
jgi:hypothetical protein